MAFTYGFYNSVNGDRKYSAKQFGSIFDGVINDGVYFNIGDRMMVETANNGFQVNIKTGRAWFSHTWTLNDTKYALQLPNPEVLLNKYVAVVLEVNETNSVRRNSFKYVEGTPSTSPQYPTLTNTTTIHQHPLAYVLIRAGATVISQSDIRNMVGTSACPFVTGAVSSMNIDPLIAQWEAQWNEWIASCNSQWASNLTAKNNEFNSFMSTSRNDFNSFMSTSRNEYNAFYARANQEFNQFMLDSDEAVETLLEYENLKADRAIADIRQLGTDTINEFRGSTEEFLESEREIWHDWFVHIQGQLSEDAATRLQKQIDSLAFATVLKRRAVLGITAYSYKNMVVFGAWASKTGETVIVGAPTQMNVYMSGLRAIISNIVATVEGKKVLFDTDWATFDGETVFVEAPVA